MGILIKAFFSVVVNGFALYVLVRYVNGVSFTGGLQFFVLGGAILGLLNAFVKPVLKMIPFPIPFGGGIFTLLINAGLLWFLSYFLEVMSFSDIGLSFSSLKSYAVSAFVVGLINFIISLID